MLKWLLILLLLPFTAQAQNNPGVIIKGSFAVGHCLSIVNGYTIQDSGSACGGSTLTLGTSASVTNPQVSGDATTGIYSSAPQQIQFSAAGTNQLTIGTTAITATQPMFAASFEPTSGTTPAYGIYAYSAGLNWLGFATAGNAVAHFEGSTWVFGNAAGSNNAIIGSTVRVQGGSDGTSSIGLLRYDNSSSGTWLSMSKSRSSIITLQSAVSANDTEATISMEGSDGGNFQQSSAIIGQVDNTVSTGIVPGRIVLSTAAASSGILTEAMRINSTQSVSIGTAIARNKFDVFGPVTLGTSIATNVITYADGGVTIGTTQDLGAGKLNVGSNYYINGTVVSSGGGSSNLGSLTANSPLISGDPGSGLNTTAAQQVGIAIGSVQMLNIGTSATTGVPQVSNNGWISYTQNTDPVLMPHLRKCMSNVDTANTGGTNAGRCRILGYGASVEYGYGSQGAGNDVKTYAYLNQLARYLEKDYGVPADFSSFMGDSDNSSYNTTTGADPRWTSLTGFTNATSNLTLGGQPFFANANTVTANNKPDKFWNTATIWYFKYSGGPTLGFAVNGGSVTTASTNATAALASTTITAASTGINTLNITCNSANCGTAQGFVEGVEYYDSAHPGISVIGAGAFGDTTTQLVSANPVNAAFTGLTVLQGIAPDVVIVGGGMLGNDANASISVSTSATNMATMFTAITAQSDLVCVTEQHATTPYTDAIMKPYVQAMIKACKAAGGVVVDNWSAQNSYSPFTITSGGTNWSFDGAHLTLQGYNDMAANVAYALEQAVHPVNGMRPALEMWSKQTDVNNVLTEGSATGANPTFNLQGPDTNISLSVMPIGTGGFEIGTTTPSSAELTIRGNIAGVANAAPTCGTGCTSITAGSSNLRGSLVTSSAVSSITLNFSTTGTDKFASAPFCTLSQGGTTTALGASTTTSALTISAAVAVTTDTITWHCLQ